MRIVFMGTPEFAVPSLRILIENNFQIISVVTVPDKPIGRGQQLLPSPVKQFAIEQQLPILQPEKMKDESFINQIKSLEPELIVVVAFRILPREIFTIPKYGSFNLHASLLPKYRGAAPINWAVIKGEKETGVTTFFLEEKVDTGNIILQARVSVGENETAGELHDKLAEIGAEVVLHTVRLIESGKANPKKQDDSLASPAPKIFKENCRIDWTKSSSEIHNFIRGLSPKPCAYTYHGHTMLKIYRTQVVNSFMVHPAGSILKVGKQLVISGGEGAVEVLEIQQEGKRKLSAEEFLRGFHLKVGDRFI